MCIRDSHRPLAEPSSVGSPGSWSLTFGLPGGCASSRLDHGLKVYGIRGGCASSRLIHGHPNSPEKIAKNRWKIAFSWFYTGNPGLIQKLKVSKCVCRSTLASVCNEPTFFSIFGPARGQIFGKKAETILNNRLLFAFFVAF